MEELQPPIYLGDFRIGEPVTAITDVLVSLVCFYAFVKLKQGETSPIRNYFRYYFLLLGMATLWGGVVTHALIYFLSQPWKVPGWIISTWAISLIAFAMVQLHQELIPKIKQVLIILIVFELILVMSVIIYTTNFKWAGAHSAFGLFLIVGSLSVRSYLKFKDRGSLWMLYGLGIFLISAIIFSKKLSLHTWFNHVDMTHVLMAVASFIMFKSAEKLLTDKTPIRKN